MSGNGAADSLPPDERLAYHLAHLHRDITALGNEPAANHALHISHHRSPPPEHPLSDLSYDEQVLEHILEWADGQWPFRHQPARFRVIREDTQPLVPQEPVPEPETAEMPAVGADIPPPPAAPEPYPIAPVVQAFSETLAEPAHTEIYPPQPGLDYAVPTATDETSPDLPVIPATAARTEPAAAPEPPAPPATPQRRSWRRRAAIAIAVAVGFILLVVIAHNVAGTPAGSTQHAPASKSAPACPSPSPSGHGHHRHSSALHS